MTNEWQGTIHKRYIHQHTLSRESITSTGPSRRKGHQPWNARASSWGAALLALVSLMFVGYRLGVEVSIYQSSTGAAGSNANDGGVEEHKMLLRLREVRVLVVIEFLSGF